MGNGTRIIEQDQSTAGLSLLEVPLDAPEPCSESWIRSRIGAGYCAVVSKLFVNMSECLLVVLNGPIFRRLCKS
jgi:hypothetical protein